MTQKQAKLDVQIGSVLIVADYKPIYNIYDSKGKILNEIKRFFPEPARVRLNSLDFLDASRGIMFSIGETKTSLECGKFSSFANIDELCDLAQRLFKVVTEKMEMNSFDRLGIRYFSTFALIETPETYRAIGQEVLMKYKEYFLNRQVQYESTEISIRHAIKRGKYKTYLIVLPRDESYKTLQTDFDVQLANARVDDIGELVIDSHSFLTQEIPNQFC